MQKITIKNSEVLGALMTLNEIAQIKLPATGALKVRKLLKSLQSNWEDVDGIRKTLIEEHAERDGDGEYVKGEAGPNGEETVKISDEKKDEFNAAWVAVLEETVEVGPVLSAADFGNAEIEPALLLGLGPVLSDE